MKDDSKVVFYTPNNYFTLEAYKVIESYCSRNRINITNVVINLLGTPVVENNIKLVVFLYHSSVFSNNPISDLIQYYNSKNIVTLLLDLNLISDNIQCFNSKYVACSNLKVKEKYLNIDKNNIFIIGNPIIDLCKDNININNTNGTILFNLNNIERLSKLKYLWIINTLIRAGYYIKFNLNNNFEITKIRSSKINKSYTEFMLNIKNDKVTLINNHNETFKYLLNSQIVISDYSDLLIYSILLNKNTLLINPHELQKFLGIKEYTDSEEDLIKNSSIDITEEQLMFYLSNYLPCSYDSNNTYKLFLLIFFILQLHDKIEEVEMSLKNKFYMEYPQLVDPLFFIKKDLQLEIENIKHI